MGDRLCKKIAVEDDEGIAATQASGETGYGWFAEWSPHLRRKCRWLRSGTCQTKAMAGENPVLSACFGCR